MIKILHILNPEEAAGFYDECINTSPNARIYALSWYLNILCPDWEILCTRDHSTVMPLPVTRSLGRKVLKQPDFAWQLGVFSTKIPSPEIIQHFIRAIPTSYRLRNLCLNKLNILPSSHARQQDSVELDLIRPYAKIRSKFGPSMRNSLKLSGNRSLSYINNVSVNDMLMFAFKLDRFNKHKLKPSEIKTLRLIISSAMRYRSAQIGAAYDSHNNLCATVLFLTYKGRASILHASASTEGLAYGGIEYIINQFVKLNSEKNLVLCIDNPSDRKLMDILKSCGSSVSNYPCLRHLG